MVVNKLEKTKGNWLSRLVIIGLIMVFAPVNTAIIMFIWSLFRRNEYQLISRIEGPSTVYIQTILPGYVSLIALAVVICGLIILGYTGMRRYRLR